MVWQDYKDCKFGYGFNIFFRVYNELWWPDTFVKQIGQLAIIMCERLVILLLFYTQVTFKKMVNVTLYM